MASAENQTFKRLLNLSECCICLTTYTDPRILTCFHTFCLKCLEDIQSKNAKKLGDVLPCPLCRKEFTIPPEGMKGLQKNFFIESLIEMTKAVNLESKSLLCCFCSMIEEANEAKESTMRCLNCCENYCQRCSLIHNKQKFSKDHKTVEIKSAFNEEEIRNMFPIRNCTRHTTKPLDYYCSDCKAVVCVSCYVVDHQTHKCKEVETIDEDFRKIFQEYSTKIVEYKEEILLKKMDMERKKNEFMTKVIQTEDAIRRKGSQLKELIDKQTLIFLDELSLSKQKHQKNMETEIEDIERSVTVLESFDTYCTELKSKGSPSEVCDCADNLISRAKELSEESKEILCAPSKFIEVEFIAADQEVLLQNSSTFFGKLSALSSNEKESWRNEYKGKNIALTFKEAVKEFERCFIVVGCDDGVNLSNDVIGISLSQRKDVCNLPPLPTGMQRKAAAAAVSNLQPLPTKMQRASAAAVYCNSIFVTGVGNNCDEIWRFNAISSNWKKCASMVQGRRRHSVAFVDHVLYICAGYVDSDKTVLDNVEAYDAIDDKCSFVGKLVYAVQSAGNCVPFEDSLYIFGGISANCDVVSNVQVYDTKLNTCSLLLKPMPEADHLLYAILWKRTVVLVGFYGCFIYNFDTGNWQVRNQFMTDAYYFGLTAYNGKIFIIGGGYNTTGDNGETKWFPRDDIRCIPIKSILNDEQAEWRHYAKLPKHSFVYAFGEINSFV